MSMNKPWLLYVTADPPEEGSAYRRARVRLGDAVRAHGIEVVRALNCEDGIIIARGQASYSAIIIDWDLGETAKMSESPALAIIRAVREKSLLIPIFLLSRNASTPVAATAAAVVTCTSPTVAYTPSVTVNIAAIAVVAE